MKFTLIIPLFLVLCSACSPHTDSMDYFGLTRPINKAEEFNPTILNFKGSFIFNASYNKPVCDEFYFSKVESKENIYFSKFMDGSWTSPEIASFSSPSYHDADPFFTLEGKRIYFVSSRPVNSLDKINDFNIWYSDRTETGWNDPIALPEPINTDSEEYFFSISDRGNAFFSSNRPGGLGSFDIYKTKILDNGDMSIPVNVGMPVSSEYYEYDPFISPDESFMIYTIINKAEGVGGSDIYFSSKNKKGEWTNPVNLGKTVNTKYEDFAPSVSPDNKYIFYTNNRRLKWISIEILDSLKANNYE